MSAIATSAPARASVSASLRPSPREPPVTSATRPERSISIAIRGPSQIHLASGAALPHRPRAPRRSRVLQTANQSRAPKARAPERQAKRARDYSDPSRQRRGSAAPPTSASPKQSPPDRQPIASAEGASARAESEAGEGLLRSISP